MAITPYLLYQDAGAALAWLAKAFGLRKTGELFRDADGRVTHAAMQLGDAIMMLGSPGPTFKNPKALGQATQNLYVDVTDVDAHYSRALEAGARIVEPPTDTFYGHRRYGAEDPEGHVWYFAQAIKIAPRKKAASSKKRRAKTAAPRAKRKKRRS